MKFELDTSAAEDAEFSDATPLTPAPDVAVSALAIITPTAELKDLVTEAGLTAFTSARDAFIAEHKGLVVNSPDSLERCGEIVDMCIKTSKGLENMLSAPITYFNRMHKAWTGLRGALSSPLEDLEKSLRAQSTAYRVKVAAEEKAAKEKAERDARAAAELKKKQEEEAARAVATAAREAAEKAAAELAAANAAGDLDAAMEAEAKVETAQADAYLAQEDAKAVEAAPIVVTVTAVAAPVLAAKAGGSTLVDKYVAECEVDEVTTIKAIAAALGQRPDLIGLLALDMSAANKIATALKNEARIPGMRIVNKPYDRRVGAKGK